MHESNRLTPVVSGVMILVFTLITQQSFSACNAPSGGFCYQIGYLNRPLAFGAGGPDLDHHDVLATKTNDAGNVEKVRTGLFADNLGDALIGFLYFQTFSWDDPEKLNAGWVDGHIGDEGDWGNENLNDSDEEEHDALVQSLNDSMGDALPLGYNLVLYNCQDWAAGQL